MKRLFRLIRDRRGAVTILTAALLTISLGCLAFAVDGASIFYDSRRLQGVADAAALSAAADLPQAFDEAAATVTANGWKQPATLAVTTGVYRPDPAVAASARFTANDPAPNAARVAIDSRSSLFFAAMLLGRSNVPIHRTATAALVNMASFSVGSRLAAFDGGVVNALLSGLTGSQVSLTAMDYNALAGADVDLLPMLGALRTNAALRAGTFDDTLTASVTSGQVLTAAADALSAGGDTAAAGAMRKIAAAAGPKAVKLDDLIDLGTLAAQDHVVGGAGVSANAFDLARTVAETASGGRQVKLDLGAGVPGLVNTSVTLAVGDRPTVSPWLTVTSGAQPVVSTAQTRLWIDATVLPGGLAGFGASAIHLPIYVELAEASASLRAIRCDRRAGTRAVTLGVQPSIGHIAIADVDPAALADQKHPVTESPARLATLPLLTISGSGRVDLTASVVKPVDFNTAEIGSHAIKTVSSDTPLEGVVASLISKMSIDVRALGLGLNLGGVTSAVGIALAPAAGPLDRLLASLTDLLGLHFGQADVRIAGVRCGVPSLVA